MNDSRSRKPAPRVSEEVDRRLTNFGRESQYSEGQEKSISQAEPRGAIQPEPRSFEQFLDYSKLQFGQNLILGSIGLIVILSLVGYFFKGADSAENELGVAIEMLKLVTTTALGFVFAKTQIPVQQSRRDD